MTARAGRLAELLAERELDLLLVTGLVNVRYLTGFTGSNGLAIVGAGEGGERRFLTDFRYTEQASEQVSGFEREPASRDLLETAGKLLAGHGRIRLGFDDAQLSVRQHGRLREMLGDEVELVGAGGLVEQLRMVKDEEELERMREAAALADSIYEWIAERGLAGRTERDVAVELEHEMRRRGATGPSFPSIVASGVHGALPHAEPRDVEIPRGVLVTIDLGCVLDGYCSDCTRTLASGPLDGEATEIYELVLRAQETGLAAVRPGPTGREVDAAAREPIDGAGHGEHFGHALGHGVGLEIHEGPRLSKQNEDPLVAGNVVTVEPGIYIPGRLGVRIEDLVAVTDDGHEVLSGFSKDLLVVG